MSWRRGKSYAQDLRERVLASVDDGMPVYRAAPLYRVVSVSYIYKALGRRRRTGETTARRQRGHRKPKLLAYHEAIRAEIESRPDATLEELKALESHGVSCCIATVSETLKRLGLTLKKSRSAPPSRIART